MARTKKDVLDTLDVNPSVAREQTMLTRLLDAAKRFYQDPKNQQAYEAWLKQKEANSNVTNHVNP